jgi:poly-gamma-glutamate capsule biosynthesis protein CapA/YwtB (metallophosphatase superfamily)
MSANTLTLFFCGDVMTGRGIDQILPHPGNPFIPEPYLTSAKGYVHLAEQVNAIVPKPVSFFYIWGDALKEWARIKPDLKLINLETSITQSDEFWRNKAVCYRMHPDNINCLTAAKIDYCSLANNHVLDWGYLGLKETLATLKRANIKAAGAGLNLQEAEAPAIMKIRNKGRAIAFSFGLSTSGIPFSWAATSDRPGVNLLKNLSTCTVEYIKNKVQQVKQSGDVVIASIHWGKNWGYEIPNEQIEFAHQLIERANIDIIHGHSSHHVKGIEVYRDRLIIYGCGDFLNDYEGIAGYETFRDDLSLMYFATIDLATGKLINLQMIPTQIKHFRIHRAARVDALWLKNILTREGERFNTGVKLNQDNTLTLISLLKKI